MPPPYEILSDDECDEIYCECDKCCPSDESSGEEWSACGEQSSPGDESTDDECCSGTYCK